MPSGLAVWKELIKTRKILDYDVESCGRDAVKIEENRLTKQLFFRKWNGWVKLICSNEGTAGRGPSRKQ